MSILIGFGVVGFGIWGAIKYESLIRQGEKVQGVVIDSKCQRTEGRGVIFMRVRLVDSGQVVDVNECQNSMTRAGDQVTLVYSYQIPRRLRRGPKHYFGSRACPGV